MREIQSITIITNQGVSTISVGDIINGLEVAKIQDRSFEWENSLDTIYCAIDEYEGLIKELINCPVEVTYYDPEENIPKKEKYREEDIEYYGEDC